ncbi:MAG: DUF2892 domain-containing protein [Candidatus Pseudobacter hemicellulosilyticus]|uniref:DUF2892 domain-containing protein n=1 Tax=Candidatus Pseudobacter hemicellulosilyticus TaxID=3121375 RepID=A0AAJ6BET3_9BACT|nr:MAG: DUF2892 domain-containing protein [Pseudobacter sp.]
MKQYETDRYGELPPWSDEGPLNTPAFPNHVINVGWHERLLSTAAGILLLSAGLRGIGRHPIKNFVKTAAGGLLLYRGLSGNCPLYTAMGKQQNVVHTKAITARASLLINKSRYELYQFWRRLENLPLFMRHLASVREIDDRHSRWEAIVPGNLGRIRWNAEIVKDEPGRLIGWQSISGSGIETAGKVEFFDAEDGTTELQVIITYRPPAGDIGVSIASILNPLFRKLIERDIHQFKEHIEGRTSLEYTVNEAP